MGRDRPSGGSPKSVSRRNMLQTVAGLGAISAAGMARTQAEGNNAQTDSQGLDPTVDDWDGGTSVALSAPGAAVTFVGQPSLNGEAVMINSASGTTGQQLAIWTLDNGGDLNKVIGNRELTAEAVSDFVVNLSVSIVEDQTLAAVIHDTTDPADISVGNALVKDTADVSPVTADVTVQSPNVTPLQWQGQVVLLEGDFVAGTSYQVREVTGTSSDRTVGALAREFRAYNDGELIVLTNLLDPGLYITETEQQRYAYGDELAADLDNEAGFGYELAVQNLVVAGIPSEVISNQTFTVGLIDSNRSSYDIDVTAVDKGGNAFPLTTLTDLSDREEDVVIRARSEGDPLSPKVYTLEFTPTDTRVSDSGSLEVLPRERGIQQVAKLAANDGDNTDSFGESVAVSGDGSTAIIGAHRDEDPNGTDAGSAYVFSVAGGTWQQENKLAADDGDDSDRFGVSVGVSDDGSTAIIGAAGDEDPNGDFAGSAYVFSEAGGSWQQEAKLTAGDGDDNDFFGETVAVSGDGSTAIIGTGNDDNQNGDFAGSGYVFLEAGGTWQQEAKLIADDGDDSDSFGGSVAASGDGSTVITGAPGDDPNGDSAGSAYVFSEAGGSWQQEDKLTANDGDDSDRFGVSVAVSDDGGTAIIGAVGDEDPNGDFAGSAYVFSEAGGSWQQEDKLTAVDGDDNDFFGETVAVSGDGSTAIVGAYLDEDPNGADAGSTYVFSKVGKTWRQIAKLAADDGDDDDWFGEAVTVSDGGSTAIIGSVGDEDPNGSFAGSAYVFDLPSVRDYANENGIMVTVGLLKAIDDWRAGEIQKQLLFAVIDAWRGGGQV
jgi:hypothetical protein